MQDNAFKPYVDMDNLMDKLKLLQYEKEFLKELNIKPMHRYYFVVTKNPGEQFYLFSSLAAFLARKSGHNLAQPQEDDDPNEIITKILETIKNMGIKIDFTSNKLKQGVGVQVVEILDHLANEALKKANFSFQKPKPPEEKEDEVEVIEDESELILDRVEEEMLAAYSDDSDEENLYRFEDLKNMKTNDGNAEKFENNIDENGWKLELERVLPQLKITIRNDGRDWRAHSDQMKEYKTNIDTTLIPVRNQLEKLHKEISSNLDKIGSREKYLNRELDSILNQYRIQQDRLSKIKNKYKTNNSGVVEKNRELSKLIDKLEGVKRQMEERGSSMTDGTPLVNIKKAITKIKSEIIEMDVRIAVLDSILLQMKIRDAKLLENEVTVKI